jgi:hypothetical protein
MHPKLDTPSLCAPILSTNQRHALACIVLLSVSRPVSLIWIRPAQGQNNIFFSHFLFVFFGPLPHCLSCCLPAPGYTLQSGQPEPDGFKPSAFGFKRPAELCKPWNLFPVVSSASPKQGHMEYTVLAWWPKSTPFIALLPDPVIGRRHFRISMLVSNCKCC